MNGKTVLKLRKFAFENYCAIKKEGKDIGVFKHFFKVIKRLYLRGEIKIP